MSIDRHHAPRDIPSEKDSSDKIGIVQAKKWAYDIAVRQLHITDPKVWSRLELRLKAQDIILQPGDECRLHSGTIILSRNGKELWIFVIDEHRTKIDNTHHEAKIIVRENAKCWLKNLCTEIDEGKQAHIKWSKQSIVPKNIAPLRTPVENTPPRTKEEIKQDPRIIASIKEVANTFKLGEKLLTNLIERESGFDPNIQSSAQAKGMMQVRDVVFADIKGRYDIKWQIKEGRGIGEYLRFFRKIPRGVIHRIRSKEAKASIQSIQNMTGDDRAIYQKSVNILQKHITDPHVNIIIGSIYLAFLTESAEKNPEKNMHQIVQNLKIEDVNYLIKKGKNKINKPSFQQFKNAVIRNPSLQGKFIALASYNEWYVNKDGHGVNYAAAILAPTILSA